MMKENDASCKCCMYNNHTFNKRDKRDYSYLAVLRNK